MHATCVCVGLQLVAAPGWSNGRDIGTWSKRVFKHYSLRTTAVQEVGRPDIYTCVKRLLIHCSNKSDAL